MSADAPSLTARGLSKTYGARAVVKNVDLDLAPGVITALVGASGAGKTTLLRLLAGMEPVSSGTVSSGPRLLSDTRTHVPIEERRIGLIFQDFALFPHLSVAKNICFGLAHLPGDQQRSQAETWAERLNIAHRLEAYPHQLSGGEQQRVAIARALAPDPVAILMDEPFSGLDYRLREQARDVALQTVRQSRIPALMVTHDPTEALEHADDIIVMQDGHIAQAASPAECYARPASLYVAQALGSIQSLPTSALPDAWTGDCQGEEYVHFRPEAVKRDEASPVRLKVLNARTFGGRVITRLALGEHVLRAEFAAEPGDEIGSDVGVRLDQASVFQFPD